MGFLSGLIWGVPLGMVFIVAVLFNEFGVVNIADVIDEYIFMLEGVDCKELHTYSIEHDLGFAKKYVFDNCFKELGRV